MNRNILKQAALAIAVSAASGLAFAQATSPTAGSLTSNTDDSSESSAEIISDQTRAPAVSSASKDRAADSATAVGAGASGKTSAQIIREQTLPHRGGSMANPPVDAGAPSTQTADDIIKAQTSAPGTSAHPSRTTSSGITR